ncbi:MAG: N-acetylmuramic acid 6-phosphate etherase [Acidobacteria bacterium]|nr:N-acetylmuramic acid 6-phosphate etherase [Acidobacteriota bacterium]
MSQERLDSSINIDLVDTESIVEMIQIEDRRVFEALEAARSQLVRAIDLITERLVEGGRLVYAGAGTSGRIAMLDASELPPTYGVEPDLIRVIMAGGKRAYFEAVEGAEDDEVAAVNAVNEQVTAADAVIGVAASGTTPFTVAAVRRANMIGALTVSVTGRKGSPLAAESDIPIVLQTGAEVIMGSTRMKAGTAQKLALNTISTAVMIRLGRTFSNLMVDMPATNRKLRARAASMVALASAVGRSEAERALSEAGGRVRTAIVMAARKCSRQEAERALEEAGGNLREVLG